MEKAILLKTQLAEAAKLGKSDDYKLQRLAVILLDNFIEIQLSSLMKQKFMWDGAFVFQEKKYKQKERKKILSYYDELLKASVKEDIIDEQELFLLSFCHNVRNNLYHKIEEEVLLISVALKILTDIIIQKQPEWKNTKLFTAYTLDTVDPYAKPKKKSWSMDGNSKGDWEYFLNTYFNFLDRRKSSPSRMLSKNLIEKIKKSRSSYRFIREEFHIFFPYAEDWEFNDFLLNYSFKNVNEDLFKEIEEITDKKEKDKRYQRLREDYLKKWKYKKYDRLKKIEDKAKEIGSLEIYQSLEKYISLNGEVNMIYNALTNAASDLDGAIQHAIDVARGK